MTTHRVRGFSFKTPTNIQICGDSVVNRCQLCNVVDEHLLSAPCSHVFCSECVGKCGDVVQCPVHRTGYSSSQLTSNLKIHNSVKQLEVFCPQRESGCLRTIKLQDLERHLATCGFIQLPCPCDCGEKICRRRLAEHLTHICRHRLVPCQHCNEEVLFKEEKEHSATCPKKPIVCQYCNRQITNDQNVKSTAKFCQQCCCHRDKFPYDSYMHEQQCEMKPRSCPLADLLGCPFQGSDKELKIHQNDINSHFNLAISVISECKDAIQKTADEMTSLNQKLQHAKNQIEKFSEVKEKILSLEKNVELLLESREKEMKTLSEDISQMKSLINSVKDELKMQGQKPPTSVSQPQTNGKRVETSPHFTPHKYVAPPTNL